MKRFFRLVLCAVAAVAFAGIAQAQNKGRMLMNFMCKVKPEHIATQRDAFLECGVKTAEEEGSEVFEIYQSPVDPTILFIEEIWKSDEAYKFHSEQPYLKEYLGKTRGIYDGNQRAELRRVYPDMEPTGKKLLLNIVRKVKPEHVATLRDSFLKCRVETLKEDGCERYEIFQSCTDPTIFFIYEVWSSVEAHQRHNSQPHVKVHSEECRGINDPDFKGTFRRVMID